MAGLPNLLDGAADFREHGVGVRSNQPDRADHDHQNHSQHHCVFGDVLTGLVLPQVVKKLRHGLPPFSDMPQKSVLALRLPKTILFGDIKENGSGDSPKNQWHRSGAYGTKVPYVIYSSSCTSKRCFLAAKIGSRQTGLALTLWKRPTYRKYCSSGVSPYLR